MPLVSVIIPNYNHAAFLKQRIESVLNQTFEDFELIILDDCSIDNSREIIEKYRSNPKIKSIVYNKRNSGSPFKQWKKGIELSIGEYIWIAESDDYAASTFLEESVLPLESKGDVVLSYCQSNRIDVLGHIMGDWSNWTLELPHPETFHSSFVMDGEIFIKRYLLYKNVIPNASAVLFRKDVYEKVGGVEQKIEYCSDWLTWMKMLTLGSVCFNNKRLNDFRNHSNSVISAAVKNDLFIKKYDIKMRRFFHKYLDTNKLNIELSNINRLLLKKDLNIEKEFVKKKEMHYKSYVYAFQLFLLK